MYKYNLLIYIYNVYNNFFLGLIVYGVILLLSSFSLNNWYMLTIHMFVYLLIMCIIDIMIIHILIQI